jgi:hypothetical protein
MHHEAYKTLGKDESKQIGAKMSPAIADVKTANACLSCHALNVDAKLKGDKFNINEGNTCGNCHGPSEKWMKPHAETEGWTQKMRDSMSHDALLKEWGLYDTKALAARATLCTSCHMAIDAEMVAAGHPQPTFELDYYQELENKHWLDPETPYWASKVWLAGQVACVRDAMTQLSSRAKAKKSPESIKSAAQQAMAHLGVLKAAGSAVGMDTAAMDATGADLAKAIADPGANADAIASKADAAAKMADAALAKVDAVNPDKAMTMKALAAIAANDSLAKDCGRFGMDQQALAIDSLYKSWAFAEKTPEADRQAMVDLIETKLLPQDEGEPNVDEYMKVLAEVRGKLPK